MLSQDTSKQHTSLPSPPMHQHLEMTRDQQKYCGAIIRNLKRHRDAAPFLNPVDSVKMNVPDYPSIVKNPMDLSRVDVKLTNEEYVSVEEFIADVRLIFHNCFKYNGPEAMISVLCQNVESAFEKSLRQMPANKSVQVMHDMDMTKVPSPPLSQHNSPPPQQELFDTRPKREIHCPSKDYPETFTTQRKLSLANKTNQMKFCFSVLKEFKKNKYRNQIYPFLLPVDPVALNIPDYPTIVKQPMDLQTIENKLLEDEYKSPLQFEADVLLMFNNCYLYNPPSLPVYACAQEMEKVFKEKWEQRPLEPSTPPPSKKTTPTKQHKRSHKALESEDELDEEDDGDDEIAKLERSIQNIRQQVESMKNAKKGNKATSPRKRTPSTTGGDTHQTAKRKRATSNETEKVPRSLSYKQKVALSQRINELNADELNGVVEIIQSSMPNLKGNGDNEIVLDMEQLDTNTLYQLHNFIFPDQPIPLTKQRNTLKPKKSKREHYSEKAANKKIHELEKTLRKFEPNAGSSSSSSGSESEDDDEGSSAGSSSDSD